MSDVAVQISVEDVIKAIHLKSFDYRVLNLLLYQLRGEQVLVSICVVCLYAYTGISFENIVSVIINNIKFFEYVGTSFIRLWFL